MSWFITKDYHKDNLWMIRQNIDVNYNRFFNKSYELNINWGKRIEFKAFLLNILFSRSSR